MCHAVHFYSHACASPCLLQAATLAQLQAEHLSGVPDAPLSSMDQQVRGEGGAVWHLGRAVVDVLCCYVQLLALQARQQGQAAVPSEQQQNQLHQQQNQSQQQHSHPQKRQYLAGSRASPPTQDDSWDPQFELGASDLVLWRWGAGIVQPDWHLTTGGSPAPNPAQPSALLPSPAQLSMPVPSPAQPSPPVPSTVAGNNLGQRVLAIGLPLPALDSRAGPNWLAQKQAPVLATAEALTMLVIPQLHPYDLVSLCQTMVSMGA